ncbi:MAG TPA: hypothetical protein VIG25_01165 [Pyrinomonadaceae bacterium]
MEDRALMFRFCPYDSYTLVLSDTTLRKKHQRSVPDDLQNLSSESCIDNNEIKADVITGSVGLALMIFLYVFMQGIIIGAKVPNDTAEGTLSKICAAFIVPLDTSAFKRTCRHFQIGTIQADSQIH